MGAGASPDIPHGLATDEDRYMPDVFFFRYRTFLQTGVDILFDSVPDLYPALFCSGFQDDKQQMGVFPKFFT